MDSRQYSHFFSAALKVEHQAARRTVHALDMYSERKLFEWGERYSVTWGLRLFASRLFC